MDIETLKNLLVDIFRLDKTPEYDYIGSAAMNRKNHYILVVDRFGRFPRSNARWQTPREIALETWKKVLKLPEQELYDLSKSQ